MSPTPKFGTRARLGKSFDAKCVEWDDDADLSESGEWFLSPEAQAVLDKYSEPGDVPDVGPEYGPNSCELW